VRTMLPSGKSISAHLARVGCLPDPSDKVALLDTRATDLDLGRSTASDVLREVAVEADGRHRSNWRRSAPGSWGLGVVAASHFFRFCQKRSMLL